MSLQSSTRSVSNLFRKVWPSIVLVWPFVFLALVWFFSYTTTQNETKQLADKLCIEIAERIKENLNLYLENSYSINKTNLNIIKLKHLNFREIGQFNFDDFQELKSIFSEQLPDYKGINSIYIGTNDGYFLGTEWSSPPNHNNEWKFIINEPTKSKLNFTREEKVRVFKGYDPRDRTWYKAAVKDKDNSNNNESNCEPAWSEVYSDFSTNGKLVVTAIYPICDNYYNIIAVLGSDFLFSNELNKFVGALKQDKLSSGEIFITDKSGNLLTTSTASKDDPRKLIKAVNSTNNLVNKTELYLVNKFKGINNIEETPKPLEFTIVENKQFIKVTSLKDDYGLDWLIVVVIPEQDILEGINASTRNSIWLGFAALGLATVVVIMTARRRLLKAENAQLQRLAQQKEEFIAAANRFVPYDFLHILGIDSILNLKLGAQVEKEMTIMFADVRSFTKLSEQMTLQENFKFINGYLGRVSPVIINHGGIIDKYIGDGIMALFPQQSVETALQAAINMQREVSDYNQHRQNSGYQTIAIGIGLHTGRLMLGTIGEPKRIEATAISDAVNLTSRLEGLTKLYGAGVLTSGETLYKIIEQSNPSKYSYRFLGRVRVKGRNESVSVFEVYDAEPKAIVQLKNETKAAFEVGILHYNQRKFTEAQQVFQEVLRINPQDRAAKVYVERCENYQEHGVPENWEGIEDFN